MSKGFDVRKMPQLRHGAPSRCASRLRATVLLGFAAAAFALPTLDRAFALATATYIKGTVSAVITVNFKTAPPAGSAVSCSLSLISSDQRGPSDAEGVSATVSGSTATCNLTLNYKWGLTTVSGDTMTIAYSVQGPAQYSSGIYDIISMPATGAVTGPLKISVSQ